MLPHENLSLGFCWNVSSVICLSNRAYVVPFECSTVISLTVRLGLVSPHQKLLFGSTKEKPRAQNRQKAKLVAL
jgi:hypothetical protein